MFGGMGNMGNMAGMMKKVQKMQNDMKKMQDELKRKTVDVTSGGGAVKITRLLWTRKMLKCCRTSSLLPSMKPRRKWTT